MKTNAIIFLFATQLLITACSPEELDGESMSIQPMDMPFEKLGFEDGVLEFSKEKYRYDDSTGYYYMYFANEFFDHVSIMFSHGFFNYMSIQPSPGDETLISTIYFEETFFPDEHGKLKFLQVSEILKSLYGQAFEIRSTEDRNIQIWKTNGNIIELRGGKYSLSKIIIHLEITFHPEVSLQVLE